MGIGGTTTGDAFQNRGYFISGSTVEGLTFTANKATTGDIRFLTGGTNERLRIFGSGNVAINTTTDVASSLLTMESTTKGFLPPRMTTTQKNAIATPATGLMVYDTTLNLISVYNGTIWISL